MVPVHEKEGRTPMHLAELKDDAETVKALLTEETKEERANKSIPCCGGTQGVTPTPRTCSNPWTNCIKI